MRRIFHQKRKSYDKTCRLAAAEILLDNHPLPMDVINILLATTEMETEVAMFLLLKVQNSLRDHHHLARKILKDIMGDHGSTITTSSPKLASPLLSQDLWQSPRT
nr:microsomal triglyceride transfer protein large subunit-like [Zonotrichia albicollis]